MVGAVGTWGVQIGCRGCYLGFVGGTSPLSSQHLYPMAVEWPEGVQGCPLSISRAGWRSRTCLAHALMGRPLLVLGRGGLAAGG